MKDTQCLVPVYISDPSLYPIVQRFFESVETNYPDFEVIACDDGSPYPVLEDWPIKLTNQENLGYTATLNRLLKFSTAKKLIICNDDLVIKTGELDWALALEGLTIASPRDTASSPDDRFGSIFGLTREVLDRVGYFDEKYVHFYADRDYYDRAKLAEITIIKHNDIIVEHIESATYKTLGDKDELLKRDEDLYLKRIFK